LRAQAPLAWLPQPRLAAMTADVCSPVVSFTCLKVFAFNDRLERKDAHDLLYCIERAPEGLNAMTEVFKAERVGKHGAVV
jgi:hypothetical protein